ncbi:HpnM family protein [Candidatus Nitrosoglobus terrae]|nr:HpnM family protein [Candidatus Nitrosoglobus terrae]
MKQILIKAILIVSIGIISIIPSLSLAVKCQSKNCSEEMRSASSAIESLNTALLSVMKKSKELGFEGRYQQLLPVITQEFDLPFIARYTLSSSWKNLNHEQREQFIKTFQELSITDYASHFSDYSGQRFSIEEESPLLRGGMRVQSKLIDSSGSSVIFNYTLRKSNNQWRIVNVVADGVSDLAVKRAEYHQLIKAEGFDGLLAKLKEKIARHQN